MQNLRIGLILLGVFLSNPSLADLFLHDMLVIADSYYDLGSDNNYLETKVLNSKEFGALKGRSMISLLVNEPYDLSNVLQECVFMGKGAYGAHLDSRFQNRISEKFSEILYHKIRYSDTPVNVYKSNDQEIMSNDGIFHPPCIFAIEHKGKVLLLQGAAMD